MIAEIKASLPLETVLQDAGINLNRNKALCPFHEDGSPSLSIKGERFKCFACGEGGDVIDFTEKYHGLSRSDAVRYLAGKAGLSFDRSRPAKVDREGERRQELVKAFRRWEKDCYGELADFYRVFAKHQTSFKSMEEVERFAPLIHEMPKIEYKLDLLLYGTDEEKFSLFQQQQGIKNGS